MTTTSRLRKLIGAAALGVGLTAALASCAATDPDTEAEAATIGSDEPANGSTVDATFTNVDAGELWLFESGVVHDIDIEFDEAAYDEMIETYETTADKDWIEATVTIDGTTFENVGLRLKGNSSLFGLTSATADDPEELPWLIRFDKYVDDQLYQGYGDLVIRSNSTETAMNEAAAVELLGLTGLATEEAMATALTINGGETELRLAMELPDDDAWVESRFDADSSLLYKADSEGDYSYRGDDPELYVDAFDQKYGEDDFEPLIDFLDFINNADDATFGAELGDRLDVEAFATYLAYQDLIGNGDDIDGRGNNSYLHYDTETERFTVVNWDLNLAFNTANVNGGGGAAGGRGAGGAAGPAGRPERPQATAEAGAVGVGAAPGGAAAAPGSGGTNVLSTRFLADPEFAARYQAASAELAESLYGSGRAEEILDTWVETLTTQASDLVDPATVEAEADAIHSWIQQV